MTIASHFRSRAAAVAGCIGLAAVAVGVVFFLNRHPHRVVPRPGDARGAATLAMIERLAEIVEELDYRTKEGYCWNDRRVPWRRAQLAKAVGEPNEWQCRLNLAKELVQGGDPLAAIAEIEAAERAYAGSRGTVAGALDDDVTLDLLRWRAVSWLRLGELENCLSHHGCESCAAPISAAGQHVERRGSERAYELFLQLLERRPEDREARWLLNLAAQTLGTWPDGVPARWRIAPETFASQGDVGRFRDVAVAAGLAITTLSGGVCTEDFDQDGFLDVMVSSLELTDSVRLFRSNGDGTFTERTVEAGLEGLLGGLNLNHADYDNDGDADVLVLRGAWWGEQGLLPNSLLRNRGNGTFDDGTEAAGLLSFHPTQAAAWADLNLDGWLDLFIGNETSDPDHDHPCELFLSRRDGTFEECADEVGGALLGWVKGVAAGDFDDDGRVDLYLTKRNGSNQMLRNEARPGSRHGFELCDVTAAAGLAEPPRGSFPTWFFDYDNDGRLDLFVASNNALVKEHADDVGVMMTGGRPDDLPRLYHNDGVPSAGAVCRFHDVAAVAGIDRTILTMGSNFGDLDNDGWLDVYLGNGSPPLSALLPNRMFRNDGAGHFQDITTSSGTGHLQKGHGVAFADLDNDGDQDLFLEVGGFFTGDVYPNVLYENPGHGGHWITLQLRGVTSNRAAIGARLRVEVATPAGPRSIHQVVGTGGSFGSSSLQAEIGLGDATAITAIEIRWPRQGEQLSRHAGVAMDRTWLAIEGESALRPVERKSFHFNDGSR